jgi:hypothetical protein
METRHIARWRLGRRPSVVAGVAVVLALMAAVPAGAATSTAFLDPVDCCETIYGWKGNAVGMNRTWTYSWHIELRKNATVIEAHNKENFGGTTSTSTPSYQTFIDPRVYGSKPFCVTFNLHHGSSNATPLDSTDTNCYPHQNIAAPPSATAPATPPTTTTTTTTTQPDNPTPPATSPAPEPAPAPGDQPPSDDGQAPQAGDASTAASGGEITPPGR